LETIAVIDYGMGNLHSMAKAVDRVAQGKRVFVSYDLDEIRKADRIIFPGVGGMGHCMDEIRRMGLDQLLAEINGNKPLLGVCVGMQSMMQHSEETGGTEGLGLFEGTVSKIPSGQMLDGEKVKVPHMGWNVVEQRIDHALWEGIGDKERFYFVHSYRVKPTDPSIIAGVSHYPDEFCCAIAAPNLFAVQFHPEKSAQAGLQLLSNFCSWKGD
jgi:glutamine amidotransferase